MSTANRIEVQAKTVEEAVRLGLAQLGRRRDEVAIEVLREPSGGIFGFGAEEALVRVTALVADLEPDEDEDEDEDDEYEDDVEAAPRPAPAEASEVERVALEVVHELLLHMGIGAQVSLRDRAQLYLTDEDPPTVAVDISGTNLGVLIGRKGETLGSLQYVVNLIVNKRVGDWTRVLVDVGGYRRRREESLEGLAQRVAYRVAQSHRSVTLEPMPPNERRVIHMTLRDHPDVVTESSGEGPARKVTILPRSRTR